MVQPREISDDKEVLAARLQTQRAISTLFEHMLKLPMVAEEGFQQDWKREKEKVSPSKLIGENPKAALGVAVTCGLVAGSFLFGSPSSPTRSHLVSDVPPPQTPGALSKIQRILEERAWTENALSQAKGLAISIAGQLAAAVFARILAEHIPNPEREGSAVQPPS